MTQEDTQNNIAIKHFEVAIQQTENEIKEHSFKNKPLQEKYVAMEEKKTLDSKYQKAISDLERNQNELAQKQQLVENFLENLTRLNASEQRTKFRITKKN